MNPQNRKLKQITIDDAIRCDKIITKLMGKDVKDRKEFIFNEAKRAKLDI